MKKPLQHSPGPWFVIRGQIFSGSFNKEYFSVGLAKKTIYQGRLKTIPEWEKNAQLMGAAPELLEACKSAMEKLEKLIPDWEQTGLRKVIEKATGTKLNKK